MEQIETKKAQLSAAMGDQQIIQLFFQRCEEAITQTQKKYGALCRSVAQRLLTDPRDTEECVSDTYLRAWNAIPPERPRCLSRYTQDITFCASTVMSRVSISALQLLHFPHSAGESSPK